MQATKEKREHQNSDIENYELKQAFLEAAINDLSGNIKFLDTKISIIMATMGVVLGGLISCKENLHETYQNLNDINQNIQTTNWKLIIFLIVFIAYLLSTLLAFSFGISTLTARGINVKFDSLWYIDSKKEIEFNMFLKRINKLSSTNIIENMSCELYKINNINKIKMQRTKYSLLFFKCSCAFVAAIMIFILINYL